MSAQLYRKFTIAHAKFRHTYSQIIGQINQIFFKRKFRFITFVKLTFARLIQTFEPIIFIIFINFIIGNLLKVINIIQTENILPIPKFIQVIF